MADPKRSNGARSASSGKSPSTPKGKGASTPKGKGTPKPKPTAKTWIKRILLGALIGVLVLSLIGIAAGVYLYTTVTLPDPNKDFQTNTTHIYYSDGKTVMGDLEVQNRESIPYDQMPQNIKDAIVAIENQTFWTDRGISVWGMARGAFSILTSGTVQGGSTITQQYIKILYLTSEQKLSRKVKELVLAYKMGQELTKEQILEGYLNTIYFGRGAYGIQAASKAFFGVDAKNLNLSQAVALAAVMNDPGGFDPPNGNMKLLLERYQVTLNNMVEMNTITQAQRDAVYWSLPEFPEQAKSGRYNGPNGFLIKMVEKELADKGFSEAEIKGGGLRVTTTIDEAMQKAAIESAQKNVAAAGKNARGGADPSTINVGLASFRVGTGELLALYGGPDYVKDSRNWATTPRPTGSVFKINAVVAALMDGMSLATKLNGNAFREGQSMVQNAGGRDYGQVTLLKATSSSINSAFVDVVQKMDDGNAKVQKAANLLGIPTGTDWSESGNRIAMGQPQVSPYHEAIALATLANEGRYVAPHIVKQVTDASGAVLYTANQKAAQRIPVDVAADTMYALSKVVTDGTGRSLQSLGYPAAGKTGTRDVNRLTLASWFSGTTMQIATAVDYTVGADGQGDLNPFRSGGNNFYGSSYPASTWLDYMQVAMKGMDRLSFPKPAYVNNGKGAEVTARPTPTVTATPTTAPTAEPTTTPSTPPPTTAPPTVEPTPTPTPTPTAKPTVKPSAAPTAPNAPAGGGPAPDPEPGG